MQLLNIFNSGGLWLIPLLLLVAAILCTVKAVGSPSENGEAAGSKTAYSVWAGILFVAAIISFLIINADYKGV